MNLQEKTERAAEAATHGINFEDVIDIFIDGAEWERQRNRWIKVENDMNPKS